MSSSAKSYLVGRQLFDYASSDMVVQVMKMGAKFIELDLFLNRRQEIIVTNGLKSGNWKLSLNQILFSDMCQKISKFMLILMSPIIHKSYDSFS